jgi:glycosyltransferase involved in cell wall biosynthesis
MKYKVLMIGPSSIGGISSLIKTILPVLGRKVNLAFFPTVQGRQPKAAGRFSIGNIVLAISQYIRFIHALIKFQPQIIHLHTSQGIGWLKDTFYILISKIFGIYVVLHIHAADFDKFYAKTPNINQMYTRWVMRWVDAVLSVSEHWREMITQIVPSDKVYRFINCVNVKEIQAHADSISEDGVYALFLGAVGERKGVPELIEAMGKLKLDGIPIHLWIAGCEEKPGDLAHARTRIATLNLEGICELTGDVREERKSDLLKKADIFVLPSHHEGLPIAMVESMAAGLAIVSTPVGGIPEIIKDGYNGFLIEPGCVKALKEKLALLTKDPVLCRTMGQLNREIAERELDVEPYVSNLVNLYQKIST